MITPGTHVEVVPLGRPNPWIDSKRGWRGEVVASADDLAPGHWRVRFLPPWCELGISRVMPAASLREVADAVVSAGAAVSPMRPSNHGAKPEPLVIPPNAPTVRVRDKAGPGDGEEHVRRRRGQIGRVIGECEIAAGFRMVAFPGSPLWVMIHKNDLAPVAAIPKTKTIIRQLGLPL